MTSGLSVGSSDWARPSAGCFGGVLSKGNELFDAAGLCVCVDLAAPECDDVSDFACCCGTCEPEFELDLSKLVGPLERCAFKIRSDGGTDETGSTAVCKTLGICVLGILEGSSCGCDQCV